MARHRADNPILVLGGGLAGLSAALRLSAHGVPARVLETRRRLGGRATSFVDPRNDELLDNCQHVVLGCCTYLQDLYRRLGVADRIRWHDRYYFADEAGRVDELAVDDRPAPLHMARGFLAMRRFSWSEKIAIARGLGALLRAGPEGPPAWADRSFAEWLQCQDQPQGAVDKFWAPVAISACNELPERASARYALQTFREGFLVHAEAAQMGVPDVPLVQLYETAEARLAEGGSSVMFGEAAEHLLHRDGAVNGVTTRDGTQRAAPAVISALPFDRLQRVCDDGLVRHDARLQGLDRFAVSPIVGVHLWFVGGRAPVVETPHMVLPDGPLQWLFDKGVGPAEPGGVQARHLHGVISAAHEEAAVSEPDLLERADAQLRQMLSRLRGARRVGGRVVKEKRATFSPRPGVDTLRPGPRGAAEGLYLAGDWCDTGWPGTMEGAARSGYAAADAVLVDRGRSPEPQPAELPTAPLVRAMGVLRRFGAT